MWGRRAAQEQAEGESEGKGWSACAFCGEGRRVGWRADVCVRVRVSLSLLDSLSLSLSLYHSHSLFVSL